jgi:endo-1,4-beta-xylanase
MLIAVVYFQLSAGILQKHPYHKRFNLEQSIYELVQVISISVFDNEPIRELFKNQKQLNFKELNRNQLNIFEKYQNACKHMNIVMKRLTGIIAIASIFTYCSGSKNATNAEKSLKNAYQNDFLIGAALNATQIEEKDPVAAVLIPQQFNAITPENIMKSEVIHPEWDRYNFTLADKIIDFSKKYNMPVHGHTLVWHSQLSPFAKRINDSDSFRTFFINHITTVASRYNGKVSSWDVVNEALEEDGSMRKSVFLEKLGPDYVVEAFRLAQKASPKSDLYYNDYNNEQPNKRAGCIALIKKIQAAGVRIDGVGIQGHWHTGKLQLKDIEESIIAYSALGLKVMITELDLEVLPRNFQGADISQTVASNPSINPYVNGIPDSVLQQQAKDYEDLFKIFLKHKDKIARVTFWGVNDGQSWLNGWPVRGRTNYPLLFDRSFKPKPAYDAIMALKK